MALQKFLALLAGRTKEVLPVDSSTGAGDAGKIVALDAAGKLASNMMPVGVSAPTKTLTASEALSAGNVVNIWNDGGTEKVRKADATAVGKEIHGFVLAGVGSGAPATVYFDDTITGLTGLVPGTRYFMTTTPGVLGAAPAVAGNVVQLAGIAASATELIFAPGEPVELA